MSLLFYNLFLFLYAAAVRIVSLWNEKARLWIKGREKFPDRSFKEKTIWMHCASLGEFEQGRPLLEAINKQFPGHKIALSFFSPSGYEVIKNYEGADYIFYLPADSKENAQKLINSLKPSLVLWVKYEFWFYYLSELKRQGVPVLLVSGTFRKDQPFFRWYGTIWKQMLGSFHYFFLQNEKSLELLHSIGMKDQMEVAGDTRFDRVISIAEKKEPVPHIPVFIGNNPVLVAGSTWEEDEIELLHFVNVNPNIKFIIAPHEISTENIKDVKKAFNHSICYSELLIGVVPNEQTHVLIIDNIGMLARLYQYGDVCYVGGGFGNDGVHNVLEAAVFGKPVIFGPEYEKFLEAAGLVESGGGCSVSNPVELDTILNNLFNDKVELHQRGVAAKDFVYNHKGATGRIIDYIVRNRLLIK